MSKLLTHADYTLEYQCWGNQESKQTILCFHGFGRTYADFMAFQGLNKAFNFIGINFFHHGKSVWHSKEVLSKESFTDIIRLLLQKEQKEKVILMGYSMGGKFALSLMEYMPEQIEKLVLLAPDGLKMSKGYIFATRTALGRKTTKQFVENPSFFYRPLFWLKKLGLVHEKTVKFLQIQGETKEKRALVEQVWQSFARIYPDIQIVSAQQMRLQIPSVLLFGAHDKIIPIRRAKFYAQLTKRFSKIYKIDCGHLMFNEKVEKVLLEELIK